MHLPEDFIRYTRHLMGERRWSLFEEGLQQQSPVSVRLNPRKVNTDKILLEKVPWSDYGYYLAERPNFTFDPLLHAGVYYVQEASSMFIEYVLRHIVKKPIAMLDMCAAPGGKSIAARTVLPEGSLLFSNEPMKTRAQILAENIQKWGFPATVVTNSYPADYAKTNMKFDVVLCDVPCSGEGMFRKDPASIDEWSVANVGKCQLLQRQIVGEAWHCLEPGGFLIYSTCTFNTKENEENIAFFMEEFGAEVVELPIREQWNITGSLLPGFNHPVYRFIPGITRGEGLFMCVMRKPGEPSCRGISAMTNNLKQLHVIYDHVLQEDRAEKRRDKKTAKGGHPHKRDEAKNTAKEDTPQHAEALSVNHDNDKYPHVELSYKDAISYLRREAITLPSSVPRGFVVVTFQEHPLGFVKNIGNRANNLYPQNWKIKSTYIPTEYETVFRLA
ncbi:MAG: hypothetical protein IJ604_09380 [Prevotella sp.]|nr:hypothetical protein [Prevotella sp.]